LQSDRCIAEVYDSVYTTVSAETIANICATMPGGQREITVKLINAQRQRGNTDCDVFACAYMERLARSQSVVDVTFDVPKLRCHLVECLHTQAVTPFPTVTVKSGVRKDVVQQTVVYVVCSCMAVWNGEVVVECSGCNIYYHPACADIGAEYMDNSKAYYCHSCDKV